jgi:hypothetical protein
MNLDRFARLLGLQRTATMRDRLHAVRSKYALHEDDPVWDLVAAVEEFSANLISEFHVELARLTSSPSNIPPEPQQALRSPHLWRVAVLCGANALPRRELLPGHTRCRRSHLHRRARRAGRGGRDRACGAAARCNSVARMAYPARGARRGLELDAERRGPAWRFGCRTVAPLVSIKPNSRGVTNRVRSSAAEVIVRDHMPPMAASKLANRTKPVRARAFLLDADRSCDQNFY